MTPAAAALPADPAGEEMIFTIRLENISGDTALPGPFAPGVWAIHDANRPLFSVDQPDRGQGLEALAEDGNPAGLNEILNSHSAMLNTSSSKWVAQHHRAWRLFLKMTTPRF